MIDISSLVSSCSYQRIYKSLPNGLAPLCRVLQGVFRPRYLQQLTPMAALVLFLPATSSADTPLPPPQFTSQASMDLKFVAESDPKTNETIVQAKWWFGSRSVMEIS